MKTPYRTFFDHFFALGEEPTKLTNLPLGIKTEPFVRFVGCR